MDNTTQLVLALYQEQKAQARQHENLRASLTNFVLVISGAVLAFSGTSASPSMQCLGGVLLIGLGAFGALSSYKHYERFRYHTRWASAYDAKLRMLDPAAMIQDFEEQFKKHCGDFGWIERFRLHQLWVGIHIFIVFMGIAVIVMP